MTESSFTIDRAARQGAGPATRLEPEPQRILVREVNWLGDLVLSLPALRAVRRAWPQAHLAVMVRRELGGFFEGARWVDEVIPFGVSLGVGGLWDRFRAIAAIRAGRFDLAILFPNSFQSALWTTLARVPRRAGYRTDARGPMLTIGVTAPAAAMQAHQAQYWLEMVRATVGAQGDETDFALDADEANLARMRQWLAAKRKRPGAPLVALAPGAAYGPAKQWPADHFAELIDHLAHRPGAECVLVGAAGERALCSRIAARSSAGAIVAAGETNVGELVAMLALADGFVGNDSGAMHLAGALGKPAVGIFGSTNPKRTGPMGPHARAIWHQLDCSPCLARTCRFGHYKCLGDILPGEAAAALREIGGPG
jgi:lipopolysaccharide heptosyltransferase II